MHSQDTLREIVKAVEPWKTMVFVAVLASAAIIINYTLVGLRRPSLESSIPSQTQTWTVAKLAEPVPTQTQQKPVAGIQAELEHTKFLARYREPGVSREPGKHLVAIVARFEDGKPSRSIATVLAEKLRSPEVKIETALFTTEFFADGLFNKILDDPLAMSGRLELTNVLDSLVMSQEHVEYSQDPSLENVTSAHIQLEVTVFSFSSRGSQSWTFTANGSGFSQLEAQKLGEERLASQIERDTKITLNP